MHESRKGPIVLVAVTAVVALAAVSPLQAQRRGGTVYYQVTYADGDVADLSRVPSTDRNIRRVVRILRLNEGDRGVRALSTEQSTFVSTGGKTYRDELTWNGKAWVLHEEVDRSQPKPPVAKGAADARQRDPNAAGVKKTLKQLLAEQRDLAARRVKTYAQRLEQQKARRQEAEQALEKADKKDKADARKDVKSARAMEEQLETLLTLSRESLKTLESKGTRLGEPTGKVQDLKKAPRLRDKGGGGVVKPVAKTHVMPHRVQVWPVPLARRLGKGQRTYRVAMAHPEAGPTGEFYYVAYADTDQDGKPDRLIAHSPLARAKVAGEWTRWSFRTRHERVFVGNAMPRPRTSMYAERIEDRKQWVGLGERPWVSDTFGAAPTVRGWPFLPNLRIEVQVPWED